MAEHPAPGPVISDVQHVLSCFWPWIYNQVRAFHDYNGRGFRYARLKIRNAKIRLPPPLYPYSGTYQ